MKACLQNQNRAYWHVEGGKIGQQWEQSEYITYIHKITEVYILLLKRKMNQINQTDKKKNPEPKVPMVGISPLI